MEWNETAYKVQATATNIAVILIPGKKSFRSDYDCSCFSHHACIIQYMPCRCAPVYLT